MPRLPENSKLKPENFAAYWNLYVPKSLLPRLHAYELMMAPYAIAHMKIGLKLKETGFSAWDLLDPVRDRVRIYLTNALEPWAKQLPLIGFDALAHEAAAVNEIKRHKRFTVVIGNPPYAKLSSNRQNAAEALVAPFKVPVRTERNIQPLSDDYVKFLGFTLAASKRVPIFSFGMITNRGFLNGLIHRGVREVLSENFQQLWAVDLHGDSNVGEKAPGDLANENVFDIQQGVAITLGIKGKPAPSTASYYESWGTRSEKQGHLAELAMTSEQWQRCSPAEPNYFFQKPQTSELGSERLYSLGEAMPTNNTGIKTHRDDLVIDFDSVVLLRRIKEFLDPERPDSEVRAKFFGTDVSGRYEPGDNRDWTMIGARRAFKDVKSPLNTFVRELDYRPFDCRSVFYNASLIDFAREDLMHHMEGGRNIGLIATRQVPNGRFCHLFVTRRLIEMKTGSHDRGTNLFPLYIGGDKASLNFRTEPQPNFSIKFLEELSSSLGLRSIGVHRLPTGLTPEDIFHYIYAVFHSPGYRSRYAGFLKIDFPRLPLTGSLELFRKLARLGGELVALHLLEAAVLEKPVTKFIGGDRQVSKVGWTADGGGTVWLDGSGTRGNYTGGTSGFRPVPEEVWNFHIGGYQVCEKWLKDRGPKKGQPGRTLTEEDVTHYHKIVISLTHTIRLMAEIDKTINAHGGWPGAFAKE